MAVGDFQSTRHFTVPPHLNKCWVGGTERSRSTGRHLKPWLLLLNVMPRGACFNKRIKDTLYEVGFVMCPRRACNTPGERAILWSIAALPTTKSGCTVSIVVFNVNCMRATSHQLTCRLEELAIYSCVGCTEPLLLTHTSTTYGRVK